MEAFCRQNHIYVIYTEFAQEFDKVDQTVLLKVLNQFLFDNPLLAWFYSYLKDRRQWVLLTWVELHSVRSDIAIPSSGVSQCTILQPLLFSVNSASSVQRHAKLFVFVDRIKLFLLKTVINRLVSRREPLNLQLNIVKCQFIILSQNDHRYVYTIHGTTIHQADSFICNLIFRFSRNLNHRILNILMKFATRHLNYQGFLSESHMSLKF